MALPDFMIIGAPKAGSTAVHAALVQHPQLFLTRPKEPKFFLTDGKPHRAHHRGPGDAHSKGEWIWQREHYEKLFDDAPAGRLRGESTPFYLWDKAAHIRIAEILPHVKLVAVIRDPVDRAYSNWVHLRADGLEPEADFLEACRLEPKRIERGYAPFWRYLELGRYGEQLTHLFEHVDRERVLVLRYGELIDEQARTLDRIATFLGVAPGIVETIPASNTHPWAEDNAVNTVLRYAIRGGAVLGSYAPPRVWRAAQLPLLAALHRGSAHRPRLDPEVRKALLPSFADDIDRLENLLGRSFDGWRSDSGRGHFSARRPDAPTNSASSRRPPA